MSMTEEKSKVGNQEIEYTELILDNSLIQLPSFIEPIVESASSSEIAIFSSSLYETLENDYNNFMDFREEGEKRFAPGVLTSDNLFCVQLKLHERQWGANPPDKEAWDRFIDLFRLHGGQHVLDFKLINSKVLNFVLENPELSEPLNKDSVLEARVMVRQLLEKFLPYNVLSQIITYQREWMDGSRSEYAWAGHLIFEGFLKKLGGGLDKGMPWTAGVEKLTEEEIYRIALRFAYNNRNYMDMLSIAQLKEVCEA